jgi:hypothetical protein
MHVRVAPEFLQRSPVEGCLRPDAADFRAQASSSAALQAEFLILMTKILIGGDPEFTQLPEQKG